ncbi:MAG: Ig-like domain-containing protein, partial [Thermoleophilia bacterium]
MPRRAPRAQHARAVAALAAAALTVPVGMASAAPDTRLDFGAPVPGTIPDAAGLGTGFSAVLSPRLGTTGLVPSKLLLTNAGQDAVLSVLATPGDAAAATGSDQENALAVPVESGVDFAVEATLVGPLGLVQNGQSGGLHVGLNQIDYLKLVARQNAGADGLQLRVERRNSMAAQQTRGVSSIGSGAATRVRLRLEVDVSASSVRALFAVNDGPLVPLHTQRQAVVTDILTSPGLTAGIITTDPAGGAPWTARYTDFVLDTPPTVDGVFPAQGATGVPVRAGVVVTFSDAMAPGTVPPAVALVRGTDGARVPLVVTLAADGRTATLTPTAPLDPGTPYAVSVGTSATDASGYGLQAAAQSTFRTASLATAAGGGLPGPRLPKANLRGAATGLRAAWNRPAG